MIKNSMLLLIGLTISIGAKAQSYSSCLNINIQDTSLLGSFHMLDNGDVITASTTSRVQVSSSQAFPGSNAYGNCAIRQLSSGGDVQWEYRIDGGAVTIMDISVAENGDILACGCFVDTLELEGSTYIAPEFYTNALLISLDRDGGFQWSRILEAVPNRRSYFHDIAIHEQKLYLPFIKPVNGPQSTYVQVYDLNGDSVDRIFLSPDPVFISEFEIDEAGEVYVTGTGGPCELGGSTLGLDSPIFPYLAFIAKLDAQFAQLWSHTFRYVTFDLYPRMAYNRDRVVFYVDTMPQINGIGNHHVLSFYDHSGRWLRSDSVGPSFFSRMHNFMDVVAVNKGFVYSTVKNFSGLSFVYVDPNYEYTELATATMYPASYNPLFSANDSSVVYANTFTQEYLVVNGTDSFFNGKFVDPVFGQQQMMMRFAYENTVLSVAEAETGGISVYPNPSAGVYQLVHDGSPVQLMVRDLHGRTILTQEACSANCQIDLRAEPAGIYILELSNGAHLRLVKAR